MGSERHEGDLIDAREAQQALDSDEVNATKAVVEVRHDIYTTRMEFDWPKERAKLADLERMFQRVFEKGRQDAKREIRKVLGCA